MTVQNNHNHSYFLPIKDIHLDQIPKKLDPFSVLSLHKLTVKHPNCPKVTEINSEVDNQYPPEVRILYAEISFCLGMFSPLSEEKKELILHPEALDTLMGQQERIVDWKAKADAFAKRVCELKLPPNKLLDSIQTVLAVITNYQAFIEELSNGKTLLARFLDSIKKSPKLDPTTYLKVLEHLELFDQLAQKYASKNHRDVFKQKVRVKCQQERHNAKKAFTDLINTLVEKSQQRCQQKLLELKKTLKDKSTTQNPWIVLKAFRAQIEHAREVVDFLKLFLEEKLHAKILAVENLDNHLPTFTKACDQIKQTLIKRFLEKKIKRKPCSTSSCMKKATILGLLFLTRAATGVDASSKGELNSIQNKISVSSVCHPLPSPFICPLESPSPLESPQSLAIKKPFIGPPSCNNEYVNAFRAFIESPPIELDKKILLNFQGDFFGRETLLEGDSPLRTIAYHRDLLQKKIDLKEKTTKSNSQEITFGFNSFYEEQSHSNIPDSHIILLDKLQQGLETASLFVNPEALRRHLRQKLTSLSPGKWFLFPMVRAGKPLGHVTIFAFEAQIDGLFTLRIYNRGSGLQFHPTGIKQTQWNVHFYERNGIQLENIIQRTCVQALYELGQQAPATEEWTERDVYETVLNLMGGHQNRKSFVEADFIPKQRAGSCSFASLHSFLKHYLLDYKEYQFENRLKAAVDFFIIHQKNLAQDEEAFRLLTKVTEKLARTSKDLYRRGDIGKEKFMFAAEKIVDIHMGLKAIEETYLTSKKNDAPLISFNPIYDDSPFTDIISYQPASHGVERAPDIPPMPYYEQDSRQWIFDSTCFKDDLLSCKNTLHKAAKKGAHAQLLLQFQELTRKIPLNTIPKYTPHEAGEIATYLTDIFKQGYQSFLHIIQQKPSNCPALDPKLWYTFLKSMTVIHKVLSQSLEGDPFLSMIGGMEYFNELRWPKGFGAPQSANSFFLQTNDLSLSQDLFEIKDYWNKEYSRGLGPSFRSLFRNELEIYETEQPNQSNPEIDGIADYIRNEKIYPKLKEWIPNFEALSKRQQVICCLSDTVLSKRNKFINPRDILPSHYYLLVDLHLALTHLSEYPLHTTNSISMELKAYLKDHDVRAMCIFKGFTQNDFKNYAPEDFRVNDGFTMGKLLKKGVHLRNAHRKIRHPFLRKLLSHHYGNGIYFENYTENGFMSFKLKNQGLDLQTERQLRSILSHPNDQVRKTLNFFQTHLSLLDNPDFQTFFQMIVFDPFLFYENNNQDVNALHKKMEKLVLEGVKASSQNGKRETTAFFLKINELFKKRLGENFLQKSSSRLLDTQAEIEKYLHKEGDINSKAHLWQQWIILHEGQKALSPGTLDQLLYAAFISKYYVSTSIYANPTDERAVERVIGLLAPEFKVHLETDQGNALLNHLVDELQNDSQQRIWSKGTFPLYTSSDGIYQINVINFTIQKNSHFQVLLPDEVRQHAFMSALFGNKHNLIANQLSFNHYELKIKGIQYRIISEPERLIIRRLHKNDGKDIWLEYIPPRSIEKQLKITGLLFNNHAWTSLSEPKKIVIFTLQDNPIYEIELQPDHSIKEISKLENSKRGNLVLTNIQEHNSPWQFLSNFEDLKYVLVWKNKDTSEVERIELPRFDNKGLNFALSKSKDQKKAVCNEIPSYFLAAKQWVAVLKDMPHYLLLENSAGKQKVLIGKDSWKKDINTGSLNTRSMKPERKSQSSKQEFYKYDLDPTTGELIPENEPAQLYLAYIFLWKMEYQQTAQHLRRISSFLRAYTEEEKQLLAWIATARERTRDHDPRLLAIQLHAFYLLKDNDQNFPAGQPISKELVDQVPGLYDEYLEQVNNLADCKLKPEEEITLIRMLSSPSLKVIHRWQSLDAQEGSLQQAAFAKQTASKVTQESAEGIEVRPLLRPTDLKSPDKFLSNLLTAQTSVSTDVSVLRPGRLMKDFQEVYQLARGELEGEILERVYGKVTPFKMLPKRDWKKEFSTILDMMLNSSELESERAALFILKAALLNPAKFPSSADLSFLYDASKTKISKTQFIQEKLFLIVHETLTIQTLLKKRPPKVLSFPFVKQFDQGLSDSNLFSYFLPEPSKNMQIEWNEEDLKKSLFIGSSNGNPLSSILTFSGERIFGIPTEDGIIENELRKVGKHLDHFQRYHANKCAWHSIRNRDLFYRQKSNIEAQILNIKATLRQKEHEILMLANKAPKGKASLYFNQLNAIGDKHSPITFEHVIQLFWRRDNALYINQNKELTFEDIAVLQNQLSEYLVEATFSQRLQRLVNIMSSILSADEANQTQKLPFLIEDFLKEANAQRAYKISEHPEYLVLEHYLNILMRDDQVKNINLLNIKDGKIGDPSSLGIILESSMGSGKTSVLFTLLGLLNADGDHLSIGMMTEALIRSQSSQISKSQDNHFKQSVQVVEFNSETKIDAEFLSQTLKRLKTIQKNRQLMLITPDSFNSLYLKFINHLSIYSQAGTAGKHLDLEITLFRNIFQFLKTKSRLIVDEADQIFNPKHEYHRALGNPDVANSEEVNLIMCLYRAILKDPYLQQINFDFLPNPQGQPFTLEQYKKIKGHLATILLEQNLGQDKFEDYFKNLSTAERLHLFHFIIDQPDAHNNINTILQNVLPDTSLSAKEYVESIPDSRLKDLLALAREEINTLLPSTLPKLADVHYGVTNSKPYAIPFHGSDQPAIKSEFGNIYEAVNFSMQYYIKKKVGKVLVQEEVNRLKELAIRELRENASLSLEDTQAYKRFKTMCSNNRYPLFGNEDQIDEIIDIINQSPLERLYFFRQYIASSMVSYPDYAKASPQLFNFLLNKVNGFTGTQWNSDVFPERLDTVEDPTIIGKTLTLLLQNSVGKVHVIKPFEVNHFAEEIIGKQRQFHQIHAIIDIGGLIRGISRLDLARQLLEMPCQQKRNPPINGVAFYNEDNTLMMLERGKWEPIPFEASHLPVNERLTFYDQKHTTGANIKQDPQAVALVTFSRFNILRDILQGVWRLREIDKLQQVEFLISEDDKNIIISTLNTLKKENKKTSASLSLEDLLLYATHNQAIQKGDNNYRALKHKMNAILQAEVFEALLDSKKSNEEIKSVFAPLEKLFIKKDRLSLWDSFGEKRIYKESEQVIQEDLAAFSPYLSIFKQNAVLASKAQQTLRSLHQLATDYIPLLPAQMISSKNPIQEYGREIEVEREQEREVEKEQEIENSINAEREVEQENELQKMNNRPFICIAPNVKDSFSWFKPSPINEINEEIASLDIFKPESLSDLRHEYANCIGKISRFFVSLADTLKQDSVLASYADCFDSHLLSTVNFQPIYDTYGHYPPYKPFGLNQKELSGVLAIQDPQEGLKLILLDQEDARTHKAYFMDTQDKWTPPLGKFKGSYHDLHHFYHSFEKHFECDNQKFLNLLVQAKFFNGDTDYTLEEQAPLKRWIQEKGVERMLTLFTNHIIVWKSASQAAFPTSVLNQIFNQIEA